MQSALLQTKLQNATAKQIILVMFIWMKKYCFDLLQEYMFQVYLQKQKYSIQYP